MHPREQSKQRKIDTRYKRQETKVNLASSSTTSYLLQGALVNSKSKPAPRAVVATSDGFSDEVFLQAAKWWAQYLPGVREIGGQEVEHDYKKTRQPPVTKKQYNDFVRILSEKLRSHKVEKYAEIPYIELKYIDHYNTGLLLEDAKHNAGIKDNESGSFPFQCGLFPYTTEMKIYKNGLIIVGHEVIVTDPSLTHFGKDTDFSSAPYMKFSGDKFRVVTIDLSKVSKLCMSTCGMDWPRISLYTISEIQSRLFPHPDLQSNLYARVNLCSFKGTENKFIRLTNDELVAILQDEEKFAKHFDVAGKGLHYLTDKDGYTGGDCCSVGPVSREKIGDDYYMNVSKPIKVLSAPQAGTVNEDRVTQVSAKDFIILQHPRHLGVLRSVDNPGYVAKQCDKRGKILSEKIYLPGDALPAVSARDTNDDELAGKAKRSLRIQ